jgi:hypothetical protein
MNEQERVEERLSRIERLRAQGAGPRALLEDVRALLCEGERWIAAGGGDLDADLVGPLGKAQGEAQKPADDRHPRSAKPAVRAAEAAAESRRG